MQPSRINAQVRAHFATEQISVDVQEYERLTDGIKQVLASSDSRMLLSNPNQAIFSAVPVNQRILVESPVNLMKVIKNSVEAEGIRHAHIRDGAAVIKYLHWLDENIDSGNVTELSGSDVLGDFRR